MMQSVQSLFDTLIRKLAASRVMIAFFNDIDVASDNPHIPAAQYFATKGFFASYNDRFGEPLTEAVQSIWKQALNALKENRLDPMLLAKQVRQAEAANSPKLKRTRGEVIQSMWRTLTAHVKKCEFTEP